MQKFLNEEHRHFSQLLRNPWRALALFVFTVASVAMVIIAFLCDTLTLLQQNILLELGLLFCCFLVVFLIIPSIMRLVLNIVFKTRSLGTGVKNLPLGYIPPPPNSPAPRWALKSFRETIVSHNLDP